MVNPVDPVDLRNVTPRVPREARRSAYDWVRTAGYWGAEAGRVTEEAVERILKGLDREAAAAQMDRATVIYNSLEMAATKPEERRTVEVFQRIGGVLTPAGPTHVNCRCTINPFDAI